MSDDINKEDLVRAQDRVMHVLGLAVQLQSHMYFMNQEVATVRQLIENIAGEILVIRAAYNLPEQEALQLSALHEVCNLYIETLTSFEEWTLKGPTSGQSWSFE